MSKSCRWSICLAVIFLIGLSTYVNAAASKITLNFIGMDQAGMTVDEQKKPLFASSKSCTQTSR